MIQGMCKTPSFWCAVLNEATILAALKNFVTPLSHKFDCLIVKEA
jgi:hypothetical protein